MPTPKKWDDVLQAPLFLVNLDRCTERLETSMERIQKAGFTNIQRWRATDATQEHELEEGWKELGTPKIDIRDIAFKKYKGAQGCAITHYRLWKHMVEKKIPYAVVMEDDVAFHKHWNVLSPIYYEVTAKNYDILYLGNYNDNNMLLAPIVITPVFCTHAYVITLEGAKKLLSLCLKRTEGVFTLDSMLVFYMRKAIAAQGAFYPFRWYVWNGQLFPDDEYMVDNVLAKRNTGLVFQDGNMDSDVLPLDGDWVPTYIPYVSSPNASQGAGPGAGPSPFSQGFTHTSPSPMKGPSPYSQPPPKPMNTPIQSYTPPFQGPPGPNGPISLFPKP